jgi:hypothetical protein
LRLAVQLLDPAQEPAQRGLVRRVAVHHLVSQRESFWRDHQRHDYLLAVRPPIPAVASLGFGVLFPFALYVGAGQIVQQHVETHLEQILSALLQMYE